MKKVLRMLLSLSFTSLLALPAFAISPYADLNRPTQVRSTFAEQHLVREATNPENPEMTRDEEVQAIQAALKADELDRKNTMRDALRQENLEDRVKGHSDLELALAEKNIDLHLGKALVDMNGNRVRMEEYVLRPAANQVQFINLTMRDQRLDYINYTATFNDILPRNTSGLWHKDFGKTRPSVYLTDETETFSNLTDAVVLNTQYFNPTLDTLTRHYLLPVRQNSLSVNSAMKYGTQRAVPTDDFSEIPGAVGAAGFKQELINHNFLARRTTFLWKDGTETSLETYLIDAEGGIQTLDPASIKDWIYWFSHAGELVFNSYTEAVWRSTEFEGRTIDNVSQFLTLTTFLSDPRDKNP
ncbi:MAG: hypothetical protein HGA76_02250 [Candidatus Firestonebacteria bacterium]|nr:hypothetical protein [Candidatus Firestonebacteria bacterium]